MDDDKEALGGETAAPDSREKLPRGAKVVLVISGCLAALFGVLIVVAIVAFMALIPESRPTWLLSDRAEVEICYSYLGPYEDMPGHCSRWHDRGVITCTDDPVREIGSESPCVPTSPRTCKVTPWPADSEQECLEWWRTANRPELEPPQVEVMEKSSRAEEAEDSHGVSG